MRIFSFFSFPIRRTSWHKMYCIFPLACSWFLYLCVCVCPRFLVCVLVLLLCYGYVLLIWRNSTWKSTLWLLFKWYLLLLPWKLLLLFSFSFFALPPLTPCSFFFSAPTSSPLLLFSFFFIAFFFFFFSVLTEMHMVWHIFTTVQTQAQALTVCAGLHCLTDEDCTVSLLQQERRQRALAKCHLRGGNSVVCPNTWIKTIISN